MILTTRTVHAHHACREERKDLGLRVMVFSGDDDSVCATQGTQLWIQHMPWSVQQSQEWMAWCVPAWDAWVNV